jgi:hypothetical protein
MCVPYYILLYALVVSQKVYMCPILHTSICASSLAEGVLSRTCDIRCPRVLVVWPDTLVVVWQKVRTSSLAEGVLSRTCDIRD